MCTPGILDALAIASASSPIMLLTHNATQYAIITFYSLLYVKVYRSIIRSKKSLIVTLVDLLSIPNVSTRFIKDAREALFSLALYSLNRTALIELGIMLPLFALVVKDRERKVVEDVTIMNVQLVGCNKSMEAL